MADWKKVEDQIFKFEEEGDSIEGKLVAVQDGTTYGNKVYKIMGEGGKIFTVFSTKVMESQMELVEVGQLVKIVFTGTKPAKKKGQNPLKLFEVYAK